MEKVKVHFISLLSLTDSYSGSESDSKVKERASAAIDLLQPSFTNTSHSAISSSPTVSLSQLLRPSASLTFQLRIADTYTQHIKHHIITTEAWMRGEISQERGLGQVISLKPGP